MIYSLDSLLALPRQEREQAALLLAEKARRAALPPQVTARLREPHPEQRRFIESAAKRKVIRAGRRGGKTVGVAILAVREFIAGRRVLYATPTQEQLDRFWHEVRAALQDEIDAGRLYKNETLHIIERVGTENRIRAKSAWNADTLRGDYAGLLLLDEYQLMAEDAWGSVGAPMLLDNDGDAVFIYTPPSMHSRSVSKARDKRHAAKLFKRAQADTTGRWAAFHFHSRANPYLSDIALSEIASDMTALAYRQEIEAEDLDALPGALWTPDRIDSLRVAEAPRLTRIVVGVDPSGSADGNACGIVAVGSGLCNCLGYPETHGFVLADGTIQASPGVWAAAAVALYHRLKADALVAEANFGGEMVARTIETIPGAPSVELVTASRGKAQQAEPIAAHYEHHRVHHVGQFPELEDEMCSWTPGTAYSPNRMDALVWGITELDLSGGDAYGEVIEAEQYRIGQSDY